MREIEQALQGMANGFEGLAAAVRAQTEELRRELYPKTEKPAPTNVIRFPLDRKPVRPRVRLGTTLTRWPSWGTEHVMTCTKQGCLVCRRLQGVKHGA